MKRSAIITGAAGGIGQALCKEFTNAGYHVIASDLGTDCPIVEAAAWVSIDLDRLCNESNYRQQMVCALRQAAGDSHIAALINNAAVQTIKPVELLTVEDWANTLNVNLLVPFLLTQALLTDLEAANGSVVNISSIHATQTKAKFTAYATSKAALNGLTRSLAVELGSRVRVNAICPAAIATPMLIAGFSGHEEGLNELGRMHPVERIGEPEEVAALALFLASDAARFITGSEMTLDGGISARLHDPA